MVQTDPGHLAVSESKQQSTEESYRHGSSFRSNSQQFHSLQRPRAADFDTFEKSSLISSAQTAASDSSAIYANHSLQSTLRDSDLRVHTAYGPSAQENYYNPHHIAYTSAASPSSYSPTAQSDPMATTAQMQRPAYPPIYHTPQSNSPASVASQPHDPHGRHMYTQSPQMPHQMYGYPPYGPINPVQPSPYATHGPPAQTHPLTSQPMMMPPQTTTAAHISQHQSQHASAPSLSSSPILKMDSTQNTSMQRPMLNPPLFSPSQVSMPSGGIHQISSAGTSSSAAPGPIPATTPLVVRQDSNGVQWIAFEYSRDRVKMEYTIRCDVESVNVDNLSQDFKTENCVYPRACCSKDQYRGNRLVYETECNTVGWALAELNPSLRGKRGLIQRAVDSWRNSNQDQRLRSRRVRRQAKANYRKQSTAPPTPHMPTAMGLGSGLPSVPAMSGHQGPRHSLSGPGTMPGMAPPQLHHHHHTHLDGSPKIEEVSGPTELPAASQRRDDPAATPAVPVTADLRPAQTFHDASRHPPSTSTRPSIPPLLHDSGLGALPPSRTIATSTRQTRANDSNNSEGDELSPSNDDLFGALPAGKRRTFILVEDPQRGARVRVKVTLDKVNMDEIPDSYRKANAVYPRTYFPIQMRDAPGASVPHSRFSRDDAELGDDADVAVGRTIVQAPSLDGDYEIEVPQLSRRRHRKEILLNDLSYRLSWSQSRVFAERMLFLQRSLDAYRNKMRSSILAAGSDPSEVPDHLDTRRGKRRFLQRCAQSDDEGGIESGSGGASRRAVEEIE